MITAYNRTINWIGPVDNEHVAEVLRTIDELSSENNLKITINLSSQGGQVSTGIAFYDEVRSKNLPPLCMNALGQVGSSAIVVLMSANMRTAGPNTLFAFHPLSRMFFADTDYSADDLREQLGLVGKTEQLYQSIIAQQMKNIRPELDVTHETIASWCKERKVFSYDEARMFGIIS